MVRRTGTKKAEQRKASMRARGVRRAVAVKRGLASIKLSVLSEDGTYKPLNIDNSIKLEYSEDGKIRNIIMEAEDLSEGPGRFSDYDADLDEPVDSEEQGNLTVRGTPRIRRPKRSRDELGGDPNDESNRYDVKLGGRVPRELRDRFNRFIESHDKLTQGEALAEALLDFLEKYEVN